MLWASLLMTIAHTLVLFYVAGDIPGTVGHRRQREDSAKRPSRRGATGGPSTDKNAPEDRSGALTGD